jgi:protein-disulfide isomerase
MDKRFWAILAAIAVVLIGAYMITSSHKASAPSGSKGQLTHHVTGQGKAGVTLQEWGDFQCPVCAEYFPALQQVVQKYNTQITFQFSNFPLVSIHQNAFAGARAAEAADMQGKYWQMHDALYSESINSIQNSGTKTWVNSPSPESYFTQYAAQLGLNVDQFKKDFASSAVNTRVNNDLGQASKLGLTGTPTFYLDGTQISNPNPTLADFSKVIDAELAKKAKNS